jgi:indolepyruvate ferredoxin oxidoreductase beta subunit
MDILISGVGGQGTLLASKILAYSALLEGRNARTGETIGMSQRGGCVVSHVRTSNTYSPYIPSGSADLLISFELCEGARHIPHLKNNTYAIINTASITPISAALGISQYDEKKMFAYISANSKAVFIDADKLAEECGSIKTVNTILIGVAFGLGVLDVSSESIIKSMEKNIKPRFYDMNVKAFERGIKTIKEMKIK